MDENILIIENLKVSYRESNSKIQVIKGINLRLAQGESIGIVGESGCGKSTLLKSIIGLLPTHGEINNGNVYYGDDNLINYNKKQWGKVRGLEIGMIFQDSMISLNPIRTVGSQMVETFTERLSINRKMAFSHGKMLLHQMNLDSPELILKQFPFQLSGGMKQRVLIAMNLGLEPKVLIADEPTSSLDVTVQKNILELLQSIREKKQMSMLITSHNLGVIRHIADRVIVMYLGNVVETGNARDVLDLGIHPYTQGLIRSIPKLNGKKTRLDTIEGSAPSFYEKIQGCTFYSRCSEHMEICKEVSPPLKEIFPGREVACHRINKC